MGMGGTQNEQGGVPKMGMGCTQNEQGCTQNGQGGVPKMGMGGVPKMSTHNIEVDTIDSKSSGEHREPRHKYGEYSNVLLSDTDLAKLKSEFPNEWREKIERLSAYMASTGKSYKNHLATIRNWARRDSIARSKRASRNESHWEKTEEEKQDEEAWMQNVIQC